MKEPRPDLLDAISTLCIDHYITNPSERRAGEILGALAGVAASVATMSKDEGFAAEFRRHFDYHVTVIRQMEQQMKEQPPCHH